MKKTFSSALTATALLWLSASLTTGQEITQILKDVNQETPVADESSKSMVKLGNTLYLAIDTPLTGSELWRSDGTLEGTQLVLDIVPGIGGSEPRNLTVVGNRVFFTALNAELGRDLWVTNGQAAGTRLLKSFAVGEDPTNLTAFNGSLIFSGTDAANGRELWKSDGTPAGTVISRNINPAAGQPSGPADFYNFNDQFLYFTAYDPTNGRELWRMNPALASDIYIQTENGPTSGLPGTTSAGSPIGMTFMPTFESNVTNPYIYFAARNATIGREIFRTDGQGSYEPKSDVAPGNLDADPRSFTVMSVAGQNYLFFAANDRSGGGEELYRSDGNTSVLMRNIATDQTTPGPSDFTVMANLLFFTADAGAGRALYRTAGQPGTNNTNIVSGSTPGSNPQNLTPFDGDETKLVFTALNANNRLGLYYLPVLEDIPVLLADFGVGALASSFIVDNGEEEDPDDNRIYFLVNGSELWVTDGNASGTLMVKDFQDGSSSSFPSNFATLGNSTTAFFSANNGLNGRELWKSDGTANGTSMVRDIRTGLASSDPTNITTSGSWAFFSAAAQSNNRELWMSDGTSLGTQIVIANNNQEINPSGASDPLHLTDLDGVLYFSAISANFGREPWRTDGTLAGTTRIADLVPGNGSSDPEQFVRYRGAVYFVSTALGQGIRLRSEATPNIPIQDALFPNTAGPVNPKELLVMGTTTTSQRMYFAAEFPGRGRELWRSDGTNVGTECFDINAGGGNSNPEQLTVVGNALFFVANTGGPGGTGLTTGRELFRSGGSLATTKILKDIVVGEGSSNPEQLTEVDGKLFFTAQTPTNGRELWVSNGSAAGTVMVKDIIEGTGSPDIQGMTNVDGILVFSADDGINGREVWISDGTAEGTTMLENLAPASASSNPTDFTPFQGQLLYVAADPEAGVEPRTGFIGSNIQVKQGETILAENDVVTFPGVLAMKEKSAPLELTIENTGINTLSNIKIVISGANKTEFKLTAPKADKSVTKDESTVFGVMFAPKEGGVREATLSIFSNDGDTNPFVLTLRGNGDKDPYISAHPGSQMAYVGESASFTATATSDEADTLTAQWRKKSAKLGLPVSGPAPLTTTYDVFGITLKDAGSYNIAVEGSNDKTVSNSGELGVVQDNLTPLVLSAPVAGSVNIKVVAAGNLLTYQWRRNGVPLNNDSRISGAQSKTLVIRGLVTGDTALYTCEVSNPGGSRIGGTTQVNVFTQAPAILDLQGMPDGVVGGSYYHKVKIDTDPLKTPQSYSAKGLPPGLKMNGKTGEITGRPLKSGSYSAILITARNLAGTSTSPPQIVTIENFPEGLDGVYSATVERNSLINGDLGGRLDLTLNSKGTFTGKLIMGGNSIPVKGGMNILRASENTRPSAEVDLKPSAKSGLPAMTLNLEFDILSGQLTNLGGITNTLTAGAETALVTGWKKVEKLRAPVYTGSYTMAMELVDPLLTQVPPGWSFASFKVSKDGKLKFVGRTADGEKITSASIVSNTGQVVFYQPLYTKIRGSMMGDIAINDTLNSDPTDNLITGSMDWVRPPNTSTKSRAYQDGFGLEGTPVTTPVELDAVGSGYAKPEGLIFGITEAPPITLDLLFSGAGIGTQANTTVTLGEKNKITQTSKIAKLKLNASKGLFTGTLSLEDGRKSSFLGALINDGSEQFGAGYFMLPQIPTGDQTAKTSPILGGTVELSEEEDAPPP
ncbi:ELWxxDGT repeat protein [Prosthecobacter sp. SYSU 5D2]|uniref:ELWxxDGT repeat protein n=1 Tax=Prosthecobacter sp. SYSU 5D2 TaxID=3134134 RepID=UPI0031FF1B33